MVDFNGERTVADGNSLSFLEQLPYMTEPCGRHERIALFVNDINVLHVTKTPFDVIG